VNVILRPVFNRPEMLKLSLEYEEAARKESDLADDFLTVFLIEYGSPEETRQLLRDYPYNKLGIERNTKHGLSKNILTGMRVAFEKADDYVIYIEDDILLHRTYFNYMKELLSMFDLNEFSVLSSYNSNDNGNVHEVYRGHHYAALAPLINKYFFKKYIKPCAIPAYFKNKSKFILNMNDKYKMYWGGKYKYKNAQHNEQAGLLNRLVDIALIEEDMYVVMPRVNRHMHIGFGGKNRKSKPLVGKTFEERLTNLRTIIKNPNSMYDMTLSKEYNDYKIFCEEKLNNWDGSLYVK